MGGWFPAWACWPAVVDAAADRRTKLVLDAVQTALWRCDRAGHPAGSVLAHRGDARSRCTSLSFTAPVIEAGIDASVGIAGDLRPPVVGPRADTGLVAYAKVLIA